jgi:hypothetical protein
METLDMHYEKSCLLEPHCLTTKAPKQLIYNYTTIRAWKYEKLINKLYYTSNLVVNEHLYNAMYTSYMWI